MNAWTIVNHNFKVTILTFVFNYKNVTDNNNQQYWIIIYSVLAMKV